jgi:hypothetical protein
MARHRSYHRWKALLNFSVVILIPLVTLSHADVMLCWSKLRPSGCSVTLQNKKKSAGAKIGNRADGGAGGEPVL